MLAGGETFDKIHHHRIDFNTSTVIGGMVETSGARGGRDGLDTDVVPGYVFPEFNQIRILETAVHEGACHHERFCPAATVQVTCLYLGEVLESDWLGDRHGNWSHVSTWDGRGIIR